MDVARSDMPASPILLPFRFKYLRLGLLDKPTASCLVPATSRALNSKCSFYIVVDRVSKLLIEAPTSSDSSFLAKFSDSSRTELLIIGIAPSLLS